MKLVLIVLSLSLVLTIQGALSTTTFTIMNKCPFTVWPATLSEVKLSPTGFVLPPGAWQSIVAPDGQWSGRMWGRTGCSTDASGKFSCDAAGDCGSGQIACDGKGGAPPATLAEFTLRGADGKDFYDTSNVDGFNLPLSITPQGGSGDCATTSCTANINNVCPPELQVKAADGRVVGCRSACSVFGTDQYCCSGSYQDPKICKPTQYSQVFKNACPTTYSYAYDDGTSTFTCTGANYLITFCP